jgi:hypothetical protein
MKGTGSAMAAFFLKTNATTKRKRLIALAVIGLPLLFLFFAIHFDFSSELEGIYILKCDRGRLFDVHSDLLLGDENRLLAKVEFEPVYQFFHGGKKRADRPHLNYHWNERKGCGYIFNDSGDGKELLTCFSRYVDSQGKVPKGLFVGGGLPYAMHEDIKLTMSATGMAHYNGKEWHHLWCNVNETIASAPEDKHDPSSWKFLGSKVLHASDTKLVLRSSHELPIGNTTFRIDRYAIFRAGENYFTLVIKIANAGKLPASYFYVYGDEPWVGEFGSSGGNIGWTKDKLHYYEAAIDPQSYSFAGMYDIGNPVILGEKGRYTGVANFIEWLGDVKPALVYFSNKEGQFADETERVPLYSKDNRVIFLQWGPRPLMPGQDELLIMAIGMAGTDLKSVMPVKPDVLLDPADAKFLDQD